MAADKGKSFVLYNDQYDAIKALPDEAKARLLDGVFLHVRGEEPQDIDPLLQALIVTITQQIDRDKDKYADIVEKRREAGKKSGEARRAKPTSIDSDEQNEHMLTHAQSVQQPRTKRTDNVNVNVNDNDTVTDNDNNNVDVGEGVDVDTAFAGLVKAYQDNIQSPIPPMTLEWFQQDYDEFGPGMMTYAVEQAVKNSARGYGYIQSIVGNWRTKGFQTLDAAIADDEQYRQRRAPQQQQPEQPKKPRKLPNLLEMRLKKEAEFAAMRGDSP